MFKRRLHLSFPLFLLIFLAFLTYWLDQSSQPLNSVLDSEQNNPDYIVENLSGVRMDYTQHIQRTFFAQKMFHYMDEEFTQLHQPRFVNTAPDKPLIRIKADKANLVGNGEHIYLHDNITVLRGLDSDEDIITMTTDYLHLLPNQNKVQTDQPVTLSRLNTMINAVGLELDNNVGNIQLLSRVRAVDADGKLTD